MDPDSMYLSNDPDGDADCLAALQQVEQPPSWTILTQRTSAAAQTATLIV